MRSKRYIRWLRWSRVALFTLLWLSLFSSAAMDKALAATKLTQTVDGLTATLSVTPRMADLFLVDAASGRAVTGAMVTAAVVRPNGRKGIKKLIGMKMGEVYSYMNSLDMSAKGIYTFHITVKAGEKTVRFDFKNGV